jgi:hypothetical protein
MLQLALFKDEDFVYSFCCRFGTFCSMYILKVEVQKSFMVFKDAELFKT